jgi:predicted Zn finger-like uncharacterized protein
MIIECPNCHTKFNVKDELIPEEGRKVKCSKCGNIFIVQKVKPQQEEEEVFILDEGEAAAKKSEKQEEKFEEELEKVTKQYQKPQKLQKHPQKKSSNRAFYLITLFMLIFAIVFAGAYLYYRTAHATPPFQFTELKGNFYENKKSEVILVIQGDLINTKNTAYTNVKLKAVVYDNNGNKINEGETYVGNIFSEQELLNLTPESLKSLIYDQVVLKPKSQLPFMIVIFNPPKISYSFQVEVVDYKIFRKK